MSKKEENKKKSKNNETEFYKQSLKQQKNFYKDILKEIKQNSNFQKGMLILYVIIIVISFQSLLNSQSALKENQRLIEKTISTLSPVEPTLKIHLQSSEKSSFSKYDLSQFRKDNMDRKESMAKIIFRIVNYGQIDTGLVIFSLTGKGIKSQVVNKTNEEMYIKKGYDENIEKISYKYIMFNIWSDCVDLADEKSCTDEEYKNIPTGVQNLTLKIRCDACSERIKKEEYEICIYETKEEENNCIKELTPN